MATDLQGLFTFMGLAYARRGGDIREGRIQGTFGNLKPLSVVRCLLSGLGFVCGVHLRGRRTERTGTCDRELDHRFHRFWDINFTDFLGEGWAGGAGAGRSNTDFHRLTPISQIF